MQNSEMFHQFFKSSSRNLPNEQIIIKNPIKIKTNLHSQIIKNLLKVNNIL
jgi:hypothetical protein